MKSLILLLLLATTATAIQVNEGCPEIDTEDLDDFEESSCCRKDIKKRKNKH
jgi:hypothetical protein